MRRLAVALALAGLAVAVGYLLGAARSAPPPPAPAAVARAPVERAAIVVGDRGVSEADLRRVVKEELAAAAPGPTAPAVAQPAAPPPGDPVAYDQAMQRVHRAIAQRSWTRQDAIALARAIDTMSPDQRSAVLRTLIPAMNRGEVKMAYRGTLF